MTSAGALALALIVISTGLRFHNQYRDRAIEDFESAQLTIARSAAMGIESKIAGVRNELEVMSLSRNVAEYDSGDCSDSLAAYYYSNSGFVFAGYRIDNRGFIVNMQPRFLTKLPVDISKQEHIVELFRTWKLTISGRFRAVEGFDAIALHAPVFRDREMDGSVATIVKVSSLADTYIKPLNGNYGIARAGRKTAGSEPGSTGWLIDDKGVIVYHPGEGMVGAEVEKSRALGGADPLAEARRLSRALATGRLGAGRFGDMLVAFSPVHIGDKNWHVIVSTPDSAVAAPIFRHFVFTLCYSCLMLLLLYTAGYVALRSNMKSSQLESEKLHLEEKIALQDELRRSLEHLDTIIRTLPSGLFTIGLDKRILSWNETAEKITGWKASDVIGRECSILGMNACACACGLLDDREPKPVIGIECSLTGRDGGVIHISKNVDYMRDASGKIIGGIESFIDNTQAKIAEEARINAIALEKEVLQLRRMDEVKTNFLSMVSHELRTPLSVILGNITLALRGRFGALDPGLRSRLETIQKRANQLNILIENLLNLSRLEAGKLDIRKEPLHAASCVEETISSVANEVEKKSITITTRLDPAEPEVFADRNTFMQVLTNLISNAVKFTPDGGAIEITSAAAGDFVEFRVKDTGVGIPEKDLERVFERFYQVDNTPTRAYSGTGLGLSIVKEIIELHSGSIRVESAPGAGTRVIFALPKPDAPTAFSSLMDSAMDAPSAAPGIEGAGEPKTLLVIDDETDFLELICDTFDKTRFKVVSSDNAGEGLEIIRNERPDLVLLDLRMAGMDGYQFLENLRSDSATSRVPVIIVSASVEDKHRVRAFSLGANDYISKPINSAELFRKIVSITG